jgi:uncharacterized membrane protein
MIIKKFSLNLTAFQHVSATATTVTTESSLCKLKHQVIKTTFLLELLYSVQLPSYYYGGTSMVLHNVSNTARLFYVDK